MRWHSGIWCCAAFRKESSDSEHTESIVIHNIFAFIQFLSLVVCQHAKCVIVTAELILLFGVCEQVRVSACACVCVGSKFKYACANQYHGGSFSDRRMVDRNQSCMIQSQRHTAHDKYIKKYVRVGYNMESDQDLQMCGQQVFIFNNTTFNFSFLDSDRHVALSLRLHRNIAFVCSICLQVVALG